MRKSPNGFVPVAILAYATVFMIIAGVSLAGYFKYQSALIEVADNSDVGVRSGDDKITEDELEIQKLENEKAGTSSLTQVIVEDGIIEKIATTTLPADAPQSPQKKIVLTPATTTNLPPSSRPLPSPGVAVAIAQPHSSTALTNVQLISKVKPSVVMIDTRRGKGSGFVLRKDLVVTNAHVVSDVYRVKVHLSTGQVLVGYVAARNEDQDIAVISIPQTQVNILSLGSSEESNLAQGEQVDMFGFPLGLEGEVSFKDGTVSRRINYKGKTYLEISNEILPGNSGGPLVNGYGEVVGINTLVVGYSSGETIKLAIPIDRIRAELNVMLDRAHFPGSADKVRIDTFEDYMTELDSAVTAYDDAMWHLNYAFTEKSPEYLKIVYNEFGNPLAIAKKLVQQSPELSFNLTMRDASYAMQQLSENMRDIVENDARRYMLSESGNSSTLAADKVYLDKRLEEQQKKIDLYNTLVQRVYDEARKSIVYY